MAKSFLCDGDSILVILPNPEGGTMLKPGFVFRHGSSGQEYHHMRIVSYRGFIDFDDIIGFWKVSAKSSARLVLTEKTMEKKPVMTQEEIEYYKELRRMIEQDADVEYIDYDYYYE